MAFCRNHVDAQLLDKCTDWSILPYFLLILPVHDCREQWATHPGHRCWIAGGQSWRQDMRELQLWGLSSNGSGSTWWLGTQGYPISDVLIKPYPNKEALLDRRTLDWGLYQQKTSLEVWRKNIILKTLRVQRGRKIVIACAILHYIGGIRWAQENIHDVPAQWTRMFPPLKGFQSSRMRRQMTRFVSVSRYWSSSCIAWTTGGGVPCHGHTQWALSSANLTVGDYLVDISIVIAR